jgi:hypothetical protein
LGEKLVLPDRIELSTSVDLSIANGELYRDPEMKAGGGGRRSTK